MRRSCWQIAVVVLAFVQTAPAQNSIPVEKAAAKYVPGVTWQRSSLVSGDFSCQGRKEQAILGANASEIVIVVFLNGLSTRPQVLRYSAKARNPKTATLKIESLDYDPKEIIGMELNGFRRSKTCKGLNLSDGEIDSAHIYWSHRSRQFEDWTL